MELKDKYKQHFIFHKYEMTLSEVNELIERLEREPINLGNEEMMWKLRGFISRQKYIAAEKSDQEVRSIQASKDFDYYHENLKGLGVVVVQPGAKHNGKTDYLYMTYHYNGEMVYKWRNGTPVTVLAPQIKKVYGELEK